MQWLQDAINRLEMGPWFGRLKLGLVGLATLLLLVGYNLRAFRNLGTLEAMDAAQVARNVADGHGFTTRFIRPLSLHLVQKRNATTGGAETAADPARIKEHHPDLANPPLYPCVLAGLMKAVPFDHPVNVTAPFWSVPAPRPTPGVSRLFWRHQPDFLISLFNQGLFLGVVAATFFLARRLFDSEVAWLSAILLLGAEYLWRFSVSGLSTMLLLLIFIGLAWCLMLTEREAREPKWGLPGLLVLATAAGLLVGLGALTRYAFGWLIVPVVVFLVLFGGARRAALGLLAVATFAAVLSPWVYRNYQLSGLPFGTATFAVVEGTGAFPEHRLARSLNPDFKKLELNPPGLTRKLLGNARVILQNDLPRLGGSWLTPLFLAGLLLGFHNPAPRRMRYFLVFSLVTLILVQALGRTQLSDDSPELNSENLLVLLAPLVFVNAVSFFFVLLDHMQVFFAGLRRVVVAAFAFAMCLPMVSVFLPPRTMPVAYPPYYPPAIQQVAGWMREHELMMSDIPWAVAWYGNRQCVWTTLDAQEQFFAINDLLKPVRALYLTPQTMDSRFLTQWIRAGEQSWGSFILESMLRREIPPSFPLRVAPKGFLPEQLFLTDWERWKAEPLIQPPRVEDPADEKK